jgi:four helix bundle protein
MAAEKSIIKEKSFAFAIQIVQLCQEIQENKKEFVLTRQLLRSGTSIGANVREALNGESTPDFIHKLSIAQKEADESCYWLELLKATAYIEEYQFSKIHLSCTELLKIIKSIIITKKKYASSSPKKS